MFSKDGGNLVSVSDVFEFAPPQLSMTSSMGFGGDEGVGGHVCAWDFPPNRLRRSYCSRAGGMYRRTATTRSYRSCLGWDLARRRTNGALEVTGPRDLVAVRGLARDSAALPEAV